MQQGAGEVAQLFTPQDFYQFASTEMRVLQRDFSARKGVGIYRREFHWIPNHGPSAINRRIPGCNRLGDVGIKKLHFFESVGRPGFVGIRERSCHQCSGACADGKFEHCENMARCGSYRVLELSAKVAPPRASTRKHRENGALAFAEAAKPGEFFVSDQVGVSTEKFTLFAVAKDSLFREAEEAVAADSVGHLNVAVGEFVIDAFRYSCVSAGGTVLGVETVVPVQGILAYDLQLAPVAIARCSARIQSGRVEKWQLSGDDHARILKLLSATLDDVVCDAVQHVSGRS